MQIMMRTIEFYFDFPSPYSYLAHKQLPGIAVEHRAEIAYRPFRILELMKIVGNRPTTIECKNKGKYASADLQRWVRTYEVDFARNPHSRSFDFAELARIARLAIQEGSGAQCVTAIFDAVWGRPQDLSQRSALVDVINKAGLDGQALLDRLADSVKAQLEVETAAAAERGVFGAPTMFVGEQMFFGNDRLDFLVEELGSRA